MQVLETEMGDKNKQVLLCKMEKLLNFVILDKLGERDIYSGYVKHTNLNVNINTEKN